MDSWEEALRAVRNAVEFVESDSRLLRGMSGGGRRGARVISCGRRSRGSGGMVAMPVLVQYQKSHDVDLRRLLTVVIELQSHDLEDEFYAISAYSVPRASLASTNLLRASAL